MRYLILLTLLSCNSQNSYIGTSSSLTSNFTPNDPNILPEETLRPEASITSPVSAKVGRSFNVQGTCNNTEEIIITNIELENDPIKTQCVDGKFDIPVRFKVDATNGPQRILVTAKSKEGATTSVATYLELEYQRVKEISGLKFWVDSLDEKTLMSDVDCKTEALIGTEVQCWLDKSGNNQHVLQFDKNRAPIKELGALIFDGVDDVLEDINARSYINNTSGFEIFAVVRPALINVDMAFWDTESRDIHDDLPSFRFDKEGSNSGCRRCLKVGVTTDQGSGQTESASGMQDRNRLHNASWSSGTHIKIYDEGKEAIEPGSKIEKVTGTITGATKVMIGDGTKAPWNGEIQEVLYYNRELSNSERLLVVDYLKTKWGI